MGAAQHDAVDLLIEIGLEDGSQRRAGLRRIRPTGFHKLHQALALQRNHALAVVLHQPGEALQRQRRTGRQRQNLAAAAGQTGRLHGGFHADDRDADLRAQGLGVGRGDGVAGDHQRLHVPGEQIIRRLPGQEPNLLQRPRAVGGVCVVAVKQKILVRQQLHRTAQHADAADSRIQNSNDVLHVRLAHNALIFPSIIGPMDGKIKSARP